jgi:hypothetical protein
LVVSLSRLASQCGAPVIALTRAFSSTFGGGDWINQIGAIVGNPSLLGIAWEVNILSVCGGSHVSCFDLFVAFFCMFVSLFMTVM